MLRITNSDSMRAAARHPAGGAVARGLLVGTIAFLTLVDLFAAQAILPTLAQHYHVSPGAMGFAVNASTFGMAVSGLVVALLARRIDRRTGIIVSLLLLGVPTTLLASAPDLTTFAWLRVAQGMCMAAAFTLTLAHLGEAYSAKDAAGVFAAYITGNVASNLFGRMLSAAVADQVGLAANFYVFAGLNVAGGILVALTIHRAPPMEHAGTKTQATMSAWRRHLADPALRAAFVVGFCILFAFIGTFTYVNFVLRGPPLSVSPMHLGLVYLVFLPAIVTTPLAGALAQRLGFGASMWIALGAAIAGLPLLLAARLEFVLVGLVLIGCGTFLAQALTTGFVGRAAQTDRGAASGMYLASYFSGGLVGSAILGQLFDHLGWTACVAGIGCALVGAVLETPRLRDDGGRQ